ncbi:MAG: ABC transporter permease [Alphaproteobacteria bacterium]|nr:ABC transporter permease [Alphaproteobacteria bacterium]
MTSVMWRNRVRTALTSLSVAWGIFMLVLLLGFGKGLQNNVEYEFRDDATNSVWIYPGKTTKPFDGYPVGRRLGFTNRDHDAIAVGIEGVEHITSRFYPGGDLVRWGERDGSFEVRATHPDHKYLENTIIVGGRFLNDRDIDEKRKVAVVGREVVKQLFRGADPLGEWITVRGVLFRVVGVFEDTGGDDEEAMIYLPITTAQSAFAGGESVRQIMFTVGDASVEQTDAMTEEARLMLARRHHFSPEDTRAVRVRNNVERFAQVKQIFALLGGFVWIVGLGTVMAGIVGVSNIMLVSVKERTREIGIRKALGATPGSIVGMILTEALLLTGVSGYAGLVVGVASLEAINRFVPENDYIRSPDVDLGVAVAALGLLTVAGAIAGLVPAIRAASVDPIVALRDE